MTCDVGTLVTVVNQAGPYLVWSAFWIAVGLGVNGLFRGSR